MSKIDKKNQILDAMQALMSENLATDASVSDIAQRAGIGKGSIYYYFQSKDEILDAVLERSYSQAINESLKVMQETDLDAISKFQVLFKMCVQPDEMLHQKEMLHYLHVQDSILLHQKFLAITMRSFTPILTDIINQGIKEGTLSCEYPHQTAEIILSMIVFSLDRNFFSSEDETEIPTKLKALSILLEKSMGLEPGKLEFLYRLEDVIR